MCCIKSYSSVAKIKIPTLVIKVNVKSTLEQAMKAYRRSTEVALSLTSALYGVGGQIHAPAAVPPGKRHGVHSTEGWVGPRGRSGRVRKISLLPGFNLRTVPNVARRYTVWAIPGHSTQIIPSSQNSRCYVVKADDFWTTAVASSVKLRSSDTTLSSDDTYARLILFYFVHYSYNQSHLTRKRT